MDDLQQAPTDADWADALGQAAPSPDFPAEALAFQPPGAAPAPVMPVIPPGVTPVQAPAPTHSQLSQTVRSVTPAPGEQEAIDRAGLSAKDAAGADADVQRAKAEQDRAKADALDEQAVDKRLDIQDAADKEAELQAKEAEARAKYDAAEEDAASFQFHESPRANSISAKLARAFGSFNLSGNYSHNEAAERIQHEIDRDFDQQKLQLVSKENIAKWRRQGVTDAGARLKEEMGALYLRQAKMHDAVAAKAEAQALRAGIPVEEAMANATVKKNIAAADKARAEALKAFRGSVSTTYAAPAKTGSGAGGGAGRGDAYDKFKAAVLAGETNVGKLASAAGIKTAQIATQVKTIREEAASETKATAQADKAKADAEKKGLPGLEVRDETGKVRGYWPEKAARSWAKNQDDYKKFAVARESIKRLLADDSFFTSVPKGGDWDNAVLGVAAASNAGTTIPALEHEAGSLKDKTGRVDKRLLQTKLNEINERYDMITNQLIPLGAGGGSKATHAAPVYSAHDDEAFAWAQANPSDPRAAEIRKRQGR